MYINNNYTILGAGYYGLVVSDDIHNTYKLFYDVNSCKDIKTEADIQQKAHQLLKNIVNVPQIKNVYTRIMQYTLQTYLCGIEMERVPIPDQFEEQVHILLGYDQPDIDTVWSRDYKNPVSETNPPRGFHASPEMMEAIWQDENIDMTIEDVAYKMGKAYNILITNGILPYDVEWLYGGKGQLYLVDFGLCKYSNVDKKHFLENGSSQSLNVDYYIPKKGFRGYDAFLRGYFE